MVYHLYSLRDGLVSRMEIRALSHDVLADVRNRRTVLGGATAWPTPGD
jgi:hypothetical protein